MTLRCILGCCWWQGCCRWEKNDVWLLLGSHWNSYLWMRFLQKLPEWFSTNGRAWSCEMMVDKIRHSPIVTVTGTFSFSYFYFNIQHFSKKLPYFWCIKVCYHYHMILLCHWTTGFSFPFFFKRHFSKEIRILYVTINFVGNLFRRNCNLYVEWYL